MNTKIKAITEEEKNGYAAAGTPSEAHILQFGRLTVRLEFNKLGKPETLGFYMGEQEAVVIDGESIDLIYDTLRECHLAG